MRDYALNTQNLENKHWILRDYALNTQDLEKMHWILRDYALNTQDLENKHWILRDYALNSKCVPEIQKPPFTSLVKGGFIILRWHSIHQ